MFQNKHCRSKGENTMKVTLKDGSVKEYSEPMSVNDIAFDIAGGLGRAACAGEVDGEVVDLRTTIDKDCTLNILTFKDEQVRLHIDIQHHMLWLKLLKIYSQKQN